MLRAVGFAYAPMVLGIIPCFGWIIGLIWTLAALVVAIRQGLDLDTTKAVVVGVIGFILVVILNFVVNSVLGVGSFLF
jgi:dolichyl-phosphate-mannose--protein O-mannosyl transferase